MKKIIMLILISLLLMSMNSCKYVESDEDDVFDVYVVYKGIKYYQLPSDCGGYHFSDKSYKVGTYLGFMGYRYELYCLNSDIEENILFTYGGSNTVWIREGYQFNRDKIITSIELYNRHETIKIEIENCSFNTLFVETDLINYDKSKKYFDLHITLKYVEDVDWMNWIELLDDNNLYLNVPVGDNNNYEYQLFKLADEYQEEFKSYITELKTEDNVEE